MFYDGWPRKFDEWICTTSVRIRERNKMVKDFETLIDGDCNEDEVIDDQYD